MKFPQRFSIAAIMVIVLVFAISMAALRSHSPLWAGGFHLLTYGVILLAIVGAVCQTGAWRAWWLGFALFGYAYFRGSATLGLRRNFLPTDRLLELIRPEGAGPEAVFVGGGPLDYYWIVGHCLWSLTLATIGGVLAVFLFGDSLVRSAGADVEPRPEVRPVREGWRRAAIGLALLVPVTALILIGLLSDFVTWARSLYFSTWYLLGLAVLGFACGRGKRRMIWFGAALFGLGYSFLNRSGDRFEEFTYVHLVADEFLEAFRPHLPEMLRGLPAKSAAMAHENARIRKVLDRSIPMPFADETSLKVFLKYIRAKTKAEDGRELSIYVDPQSLLDREKTMESTIQIDLEDCPLNTTLQLALKQLGLCHDVREGMVYIHCTFSDDMNSYVDYYLLAGHSFLAMVSASLGAFLVPLVAHREARPAP